MNKSRHSEYVAAVPVDWHSYTNEICGETLLPDDYLRKVGPINTHWKLFVRVFTFRATWDDTSFGSLPQVRIFENIFFSKRISGEEYIRKFYGN